MNNDGKYSESLSTGGTLIVEEKKWWIEYYFAGPDMRYKGTFLTLAGSSIDKYIDAWIQNFNEYLKIKRTTPYGIELKKNGLMGMTISVNTHFEGVCLNNYHMPVSNQALLNKVVADYSNAKQKAEVLMKTVSSMSHIKVTKEWVNGVQR